MTPIKEYIGKAFIGKTYHFKCDCIIPLDVVGTVKDYEVIGTEIILLVQVESRVIRIGLNTNSLVISEL